MVELKGKRREEREVPLKAKVVGALIAKQEGHLALGVALLLRCGDGVGGGSGGSAVRC